MVGKPSTDARVIPELIRLFGHFSQRRRWQLGGIFFLLLVGGVTEMAALGSVVPFLIVLTGPSLANRYPLVLKLFTALHWGGGKNILLYASILVGASAVGGAIMRTAISWACVRFVQGLGADIGGEVYNRILHQPYSFHIANNTSTIIAGLNKVAAVTQVTETLLRGLVALVICIAILSVLIHIDPLIACIAMLTVCFLYLLVTLLSARRLKANGSVVAKNESLRVQAIQEGLGGIRDILLDGSQKIYVNRFKKFDYEQRRSRSANTIISESPRYLIPAFGIVLIVLLAFWRGGGSGGIIVVIPAIGVLALGAQRLLPQMQQLYSTWASVRGARAALRDVFIFLEHPILSSSLRVPGHSVLHLTHQIALCGTCFRYRPDGPNVIDNLWLDIPHGSRLGLVGKTGTGKSTLTDIIMGLLEPTNGYVAIDGQILGAANRRAWQACVAHVPQSIYLADASIAENIAFGLETGKIDSERVAEAAKKAQLADFVMDLPQKYETFVGERGIRLSGGQRQRIGLARALYKQADLLVLDEATSALDDTTENSVLDAIWNLGPEITILIIAHRITTLKHCSRVIELGEGKIVRSGTYVEALQWANQFESGEQAARDAAACDLCS